MRNYRAEYWTDALEDALHDIGKGDILTKAELETVGGSLAGAAEHQSTASGWDVASANLRGERDEENESLRKEVRRERDKIICRECNGVGWITTGGPIHSGTSHCWKCGGAGRHDP